MFDIGWSEILIIGVLALIVVGPKDMPVLLRAIGKYLGIIRKQAAEFRSQFDEALRETEFDQIRKDMAGLKDDISSTVHQASKQIEKDLDVEKSVSDGTALKNEPATPSVGGNGAASPADQSQSDRDDVADWASADEVGPEKARAAPGDANGVKVPEEPQRVQASTDVKSGAQ